MRIIFVILLVALAAFASAQMPTRNVWLYSVNNPQNDEQARHGMQRDVANGRAQIPPNHTFNGNQNAEKKHSRHQEVQALPPMAYDAPPVFFNSL